MKKINIFPRTDDPATTREPDVADSNVAKKSEFSRKKPLPSIAIEKDPAFADSVLCAETMHIRQKIRESTGSITTKPQCPGHGLVPRTCTRDVPKPGTGQRSPPVPPGPTQGPCGDLPLRKTTDGVHKRDGHSQGDNSQQQRQFLLNPPWKGPCAVVEPTQAGHICSERLPRGLKQLESADLCHRHGHHRRRLDPLEETQSVDAAQKRGRPLMQQKVNGPKQRGDFHTKKIIVEKNAVTTMAEEDEQSQGFDKRTKTDNHGENNIDTTGTDCKATKDFPEILNTVPGQERPKYVTLGDSPAQDATVQSNLTPDGDILIQRAGCGADVSNHKLSEMTCQTTIFNTSENIVKEVEGEKTNPDEACVSKADVETSDTSLCRTISSRPILSKAGSLTFRRTTGKLHTEERPSSFTALTAKAKELENIEQTTGQPTPVQPLSNATVHTKVQVNDSAIASADDRSDKPNDSGETVCQYFHRNHTTMKEHELASCPHDKEDGPSSSSEVSAFCQPDTLQDSKKVKITETPRESTGDLIHVPPSCEDEIDVLLYDRSQVPLEVNGQPRALKHAENTDVPSACTDQSSIMQSGKPERPVSDSTSRTISEESIREKLENEALSFSVDSPKIQINVNMDRDSSYQLAPATDDLVEKKESPIGHFKNQDSKNTNLEVVNPETIRQRLQTDVPLQDETPETEVSVNQMSQKSKHKPSPQRSLSCHDLAIDVRFFKTPDNDTDDEKCTHRGESPSLQNERVTDSSPDNSEGSYKTKRCTTIRKILSQDNSGKCKYLVLPDQDRGVSGIRVIPIKHVRVDRDQGTQRDTDRQPLPQSSSKIKTESIETSREKNASKSINVISDQRIDCVESKPETVEVDKIDKIGDKELETNSKNDNRDKAEGNHDLRLSRKDQLGTGISRRTRRKNDCEMYPIQEDETVDSGTVNGHDENIEGFAGRREDEGENSGDREKKEEEEEEWFPPAVSPLPQPTAGNVSGAPSGQSQPRRINFSESNRFLRIHGNYLQGDGAWGHGDRIDRPQNYVKPNVSLDDMSLRFFTDVTPLDLAFNAINVVNSCSNSIGYHSCANQKRILAALDGLKRDDVYKHALICPLARQCATATRDFSQALHKVFRGFSNRARAAQEALLEYYGALAAGEVNSPEMVRQIQRDGRRLYMVWEAGRYVTKYTDDAVAEFSNSSSDTSSHPSASDPADCLDNTSTE